RRERGRRREDVFDRVGERRLLGDLEAVAARALDRRPLEDGLLRHERTVVWGHLRRRQRLLLEGGRRRGQRVTDGPSTVETDRGQGGPVVERGLVPERRRLKPPP